jgi:hypothetical protein
MEYLILLCPSNSCTFGLNLRHELRKGYSRNLIQERGKMDLRGISSLMAIQQTIKINISHE